MGEFDKRMGTVREFAAMVKERRTWLLLPLLIAVSFLLLFTAVAEMPVLIPFFYAVF